MKHLTKPGKIAPSIRQKIASDVKKMKIKWGELMVAEGGGNLLPPSKVPPLNLSHRVVLYVLSATFTPHTDGTGRYDVTLADLPGCVSSQGHL